MIFKDKRFLLLYEWLMSVMAIISILMIILDYADVININHAPYKVIDNLTWCLFTLDYFTRLLIAKNKKTFFQKNFFDLLSIIPVVGFFQFFRISRLVRLIRVLRIVRLVGLTGRLKVFIKTNGLVYYLYVSVAVLLISAFLYSISEKVNFPNALWWAITTATTVGYGDISPTTPTGRLAAVLIMILGIGFVGLLTSSITNFFSNQVSNDLQDELQTLRKENQQLAEKLDKIENLIRENSNRV